MKKLGGVFYFEFVFEDEENDEDDVATNVWAFNFTPEAVEILGPNFTESDWYEDAFCSIEDEFGVHNWSSSPVADVVGVGHTTYEVSRIDAPTCVERWRQEFAKRVGNNNISPQVYDLGTQPVDSDWHAFTRVQAESEEL